VGRRGAGDGSQQLRASLYSLETWPLDDGMAARALRLRREQSGLLAALASCLPVARKGVGAGRRDVPAVRLRECVT